MVEYAKTTYGATRAYVTGLSAGAVMTSVMLATYPDLFEAGAIMAGIPTAARRRRSTASRACRARTRRPPPGARLVPKVSGASAPRVAIWQGDADYTVRPKNMTELVEQWTDVNGISDKATTSTPVGKATHDEYKDASGVLRVESWSIKGMSHGVAIDPSAGCGHGRGLRARRRALLDHEGGGVLRARHRRRLARGGRNDVGRKCRNVLRQQRQGHRRKRLRPLDQAPLPRSSWNGRNCQRRIFLFASSG